MLRRGRITRKVLKAFKLTFTDKSSTKLLQLIQIFVNSYPVKAIKKSITFQLSLKYEF